MKVRPKMSLTQNRFLANIFRSRLTSFSLLKFYCSLFFLLFILLPAHFYITITHYTHHLLLTTSESISCSRFTMYIIQYRHPLYLICSHYNHKTKHIHYHYIHSYHTHSCPIAMQNDIQLHSYRIRNESNALG